jgi:hypothetical protein
MFKKTKESVKNFPRNLGFLMVFSTVISIVILTSANSLNAIHTTGPLPNSTTIPQPQPQPEVSQQNPQVAQFPQIPWQELEEVGAFEAAGGMDSELFTTNGRWHSVGDWSMNVSDGEVISFNTTMAWYNGTSGHTHDFRNFESDDDGGVSINSAEQRITITGIVDVGTNGIVTWEDVPAEVSIIGGEVLVASLDDEAADGHFSDQSVYGNVTTLRVCSLTPGPAMQVFTGC